MAELIVRLRDLGPDQHHLAGGKAANLGVLARAGLPVPDGVCVITEAYARVAADVGLDEVLDALAVAGPDDLPALAAKARGLILDAKIPEDVARAVRQTAGGPVAVRSSATAEDLPHASFAGQQDTFLNVMGANAVLDAVRRCWASLWTDRAVAYRAANGIGHRGVRLAVVIQRMVEAKVAGVMFTANPLTGRRREAVIDASPGLGEAVVSGAVNPDHFVVDPHGAVVERRLGDKKLLIRSRDGGGTESMATDDPGAASLTDEQIRRLAALGARVEELYGAPQDIEWAIDDEDRAWLTQSRPITTLYPLPTEAEDGDPRIYFSVNVAQGVFRPLTPMGLSALKVAVSGAATMFGFRVRDPHAGPPVVAEAGQRLFIDVTPAIRSRVGRAIVPRMMDVGEARSATVIRDLFARPEFSVNRRSPLPFIRRVGGFAVRNGVPLVAARAIVSPAAARRRMRLLRRRVDEITATRVEGTATERLDHVVRTLSRLFGLVAPRMMPVALAGLLMFGLGSRLLKGRVEPGELAAVFAGVPNNVTTEMDLALWRLATEPEERDEGESATPARPGRPIKIELAEFLREYGHRAVAEIDIGMPRWSEDPSHIRGMVENYRRLENRDLAPDVQFERGRRQAVAKIDELARRVGGVRGRLVRFAFGRARELVGFREMPKFLLVQGLSAMRAELLRVGEELAAKGSLDAAGDVFFLTLPEARAAGERDGGDLRELVRDRRAAYDREVARRHVPRVMLSDGTEPEAVARGAGVRGAAPDGGLTGAPASAGSVTGPARVVLDPVGAHLEPGEILVAPSTDPGWTPLFLTAGGLVMEMGGAVSHGAVVAREYGIPAVVGVAGATEVIETGRRITVDGTAGTVTFD